MGPGPRPPRGAVKPRRSPGLLLLCWILAACSAPAPSGPEPGPPPRGILLIAVTGLTREDAAFDVPGPGVHLAEDVLSTGRGSTALFEFLEGRPAIEQLREPADPLGWAGSAGLEVELLALDDQLRAEPEWAGRFSTHRPPELQLRPPASGLRIVVLPRTEFDRGRLARTLASVSEPDLVVIAGIPNAPLPDRKPGHGRDPEAVWNSLRVAVVAKGHWADRLHLTGRRTLGDVLASLRGEVPEPRPVRVAHWWNSLGGGYLVDDGSRVALDGTWRDPVQVGTGPSAAADSMLADHAPRGDLLVLFRGSAGADIVRAEVLTGVRVDWQPWGTEPIDIIEQASVRYLTLDLVVEPEGDGLLIEEWAGKMVDLRIRTRFDDAPVIGVPIRDAGDGRWLGIDALRIHPWSRPFWKLTRKIRFDATEWRDSRPAGVDLLWVDESEAPPVPVRADP
jgi:hypothetical protein